MDMKGLFNGVAVVIDDEVKDPNANIGNILSQIEKQNIPLLTYEEIPQEEIVNHFKNLSFLLLDWQLLKKEVSKKIVEGVTIPEGIQAHEVTENIDFIKKLKKVCFCPIFIFTDTDVERIKTKLENEGLYKRDRPNHIFVKSKMGLKGKTKLFNEVERWLTQNPSVYVLKEWEREYQKSKNKMFAEFQELSPVWPKIMWANFGDDGVNKSLNLGELISRNLHTRMTPFEFSEKILNERGSEIESDELRRVMEGERFLKQGNLHDDNISSGDVFKLQGKYYLNIRAACDLIPDRSEPNSSIDNIELYLLKGDELPENKVKSLFNKKYGHFSEIDSQSIIFPLYGGKAIDFRFKKLGKKFWKELKDKRIGRLLPPYINKIQQKYALYFQRQGLPRIPDAAIFQKQ